MRVLPYWILAAVALPSIAFWANGSLATQLAEQRAVPGELQLLHILDEHSKVGFSQLGLAACVIGWAAYVAICQVKQNHRSGSRHILTTLILAAAVFGFVSLACFHYLAAARAADAAAYVRATIGDRDLPPPTTP